MSLWKIVLRSVLERKLSSALTALSIALGVAVTIAILVLHAQGKQNFDQTTFGYGLLVGPKGSRLQLVLNTVFHMDQALGTVPYDVYKELKANRDIRLAIPVAVGDSYNGFRIVGTSSAFLTDFEYADKRRFAFAEGGPFAYDEAALDRIMQGEHVHAKGEAVVGATVARRTGLRTGSTFVAEHGLGTAIEAQEHKEAPWTVVGVLAPTGTPSDRAIFINLESFFAIALHQEKKAQISAIILATRGEAATLRQQQMINGRPDAQAVVPAQVVGELFDMFAQIEALLLAVSTLVVVVAGVSILVSIYNSMSERRRAIAIMRALGARRFTVLAIIELEAMLLCLAGGLAGVVGGHVLAAAAARFVGATAGVAVSPWMPHPLEAAVLGGLIVLGGVVGILPALKAYRTDIADGLTPTV